MKVTGKPMNARRFIPAALAAILVAAPAEAYIGPGAGFAILTSFVSVALAFIAAFAALLLWPLRKFKTLRIQKKFRANRKAGRVIILGMDGLDPGLTEQYLGRGLLPNFQKMAETGSFKRLRTTFPAISPVVWSTFATGVNPGKHRIFDFYTRDPQTYAPVLSSARVSTFTHTYGIGPLRIPVRKTAVSFLRKSESFWRRLGDARVFCSVNRVPVTYPPEQFYGVCLSAMCTPDLRGTQGSFTLFHEDAVHPGTNLSDGAFIPLTVEGNRFSGAIPGPTVSVKGGRHTLTAPFFGAINREKREIRLSTGGTSLTLREKEYSPWVRLVFRHGVFGKVTGITRFMATSISLRLNLYLTPVNLDPERPAMPVSSPLSYAPVLSKLYGPFATLGLAEDTWALNERIIDEDAFLAQSYDIFEERKAHLFDALRKNRDGLIATVFDTTDRIQHMFFRYLASNHPANRGKDTIRHCFAIENLYRRMDGLLGEVLALSKPDDLVLVISDHGFAPFRWGVNLNSWLWREGYLVFKDNARPGGKWFEGVDWTKTRAYAYGLAGIFLNVRGREHQGIVAPGEEQRLLRAEIKGRLESLTHGNHGIRPIRRALAAEDIHHGPYVNEAHDLFVGYEAGYRASWNSAAGLATGEVFEENTRSWSGDHCIDPELVPGVLFSNWKLENESPAMQDIAPTVLALFGLPPAEFHDGTALTFVPASPGGRP